MNNPENFIKRWSRRKRQATGTVPQAKQTDAEQTVESAAAEQANLGSPDTRSDMPSVSGFDASSLPPIESIDAATDITAFMRPGVPEALRHAALRRVWSTDPSIRNFMGPTENYWDAAGPDGIPGFGDIDPKLDVKRLAAELFGETPPASETSLSSIDPAPGDKNSTDPAESEKSIACDRPPMASDSSLPHRTENAAAQKSSTQVPKNKMVRRHGSAIPE